MPDIRATLDGLGLTQTGAAAVLGVDARTVRRWVADPASVPQPVWMLLEVLDIEEVRKRLSLPANYS